MPYATYLSVQWRKTNRDCRAKRLVEIDQSMKALDVLTKAATTYPARTVAYNLGMFIKG